VVQRLRAVAVHADQQILTDGQLLDGYLANRDEAAFQALLERHGPMVLGVCRRVLNDRHDAEDAFQATFLVLVKKAATIRPRERVGHWLYGVAYRTALEARALAGRRRSKERKMSRPEAIAEDLWQDVRPVLDQELNGLPEKYRVPLVLCDLEGKSRKEAARQLGWPEGTVAGRLARARSLLARRLKRHGIVLSAAALAGLLPGSASAVPTALTTATTRTATLIAAGQAAAPGVVPTKVAALTEGVMKAMLFAKLRGVLTLALLVGLIGFLAGLGSYACLADEPEQDPPEQPSRAEKVAPVASDTPSGDVKFPEGPPPSPARVSLTKNGGIVVKTGATAYRSEYVELDDGTKTPVYRSVTVPHVEYFALSEVVVRNTHGKTIEPQQLTKRLKGEVPVLLAWGPNQVDPLHLVLIKEDTLIFHLPARSVMVPPPTVPPSLRPPAPEKPASAQPVPAAPAIEPPPPSATVPPALPSSPKSPLPPLTVRGHDDYVTINERNFDIPIQVAPKQRAQIAKIRLFVSADKGNTWKMTQFNADVQRMHYSAPGDGLYWFALQIVSVDGSNDPVSMETVAPQLKVHVKTTTGTP
jgi:RNA polymerase sigma factor (sigma-70 family)